MVGQYSGGFNMFFNYSVVNGVYKELGMNIVDVATPQTVAITTTGTFLHEVASFASTALNTTVIPAGICNVFLYGKMDALSPNVFYRFRILRLVGAGTAILATSSNSAFIESVAEPVGYSMNATIVSDVACSFTDQLLITLFVINEGVSPRTITTYFQNDYYSFAQTTLHPAIPLLTNYNFWTGANTFNTPIRINPLTTYSSVTGTDGVTKRGYVVQGVAVSNGRLTTSTNYTIGTLTFDFPGVYLVTAVASFIVYVTTAINQIETWVTTANIYNGQAGGGATNFPSGQNFTLQVSGLCVITAAPTTVSQRMFIDFTPTTANVTQTTTNWELNAVRIA